MRANTLSSEYLLIFVFILTLGAFSPSCCGQPPAPIIERFTVLEQSAVAGEPFGVGHVSLLLDEYHSDIPPRLEVVDSGNHVFYPAYTLRKLPPPQRVEPSQSSRRIGRGGLVDRLRNAAAAARHRAIEPVAVDIDFLFIGSDPLELSITHAEGVVNVTLPLAAANVDANTHAAQANRWLNAYTQAAKRDIAVGDYPPLFQTFMVETMARRLGLVPLDLRADNVPSNDPLDHPMSTLELLGSTERLRDVVFKETLRVPVRSANETNIPLPSPPLWISAPVPQTPDSLPLEAIATCVPPECFYLRYGRFSNYLWFRDLLAGKGAGLARLLTVRGSDSNANAKIEKMLNTKTTLLAKLFGDAIINDMALIGHDLYLQDGASLGVLFEAKDIARLKSSIDSERDAAAKQLATAGVQLDQINIAGREVTLLSNRDHSIRSFRVVDGQYLFLTTSQTLVERFLAVRDGGQSLADTSNFRYARLILPEQNSYDVFGYFSPQFFQNLMSPQYNIELRRRYVAKSRIAAATMASTMAKAEKIPANDIPSLTKAGLLPAWFEATADDSQLIWSGDRWVDSRRGGLGAMLPITDVPINDCTSLESDHYLREANFYTSHWNSTEPIMFGLRRFQHADEPLAERLAIEAYAAPLEIEKFGKWGQYLASPIDTYIAQPPDDIISVQAHMAGQNVLGSRSPNNVLFAGLKDGVLSIPREQAGIIEKWRTLQSIPFYLGVWPQPRYLDQLPLGLGGSRPDVNGFSRALIGMWRWQGGEFSVISFDQSILENAINYLQPVPAPDPAQLRLQVKDLENTQVASTVNDLFYRRSYAATRGNIRLLDAMQQQFKLTAQEAMQQSQYLLDTQLVCPLGGVYEVAETSTGTRWQNSKLNQNGVVDPMQVDLENMVSPNDYRTEWLGWLRGLQAHLTQANEGLRLLATVDLEILPQPQQELTPASLPKLNFDLFSLPGQFFGGDKKTPEQVAPSKPQRSF